MPVWQRDNRRAGRGAGSKPGRAAGLRLRVRMAEANGRHDSFRSSALRSRGASVPQPSPRKPEASAFGDKRRDESFRPEGPRHVLSTARSARGRVSTGPLWPRGGSCSAGRIVPRGRKGAGTGGPRPSPTSVSSGAMRHVTARSASPCEQTPRGGHPDAWGAPRACHAINGPSLDEPTATERARDCRPWATPLTGFISSNPHESRRTWRTPYVRAACGLRKWGRLERDPTPPP